MGCRISSSFPEGTMEKVVLNLEIRSKRKQGKLDYSKGEVVMRKINITIVSALLSVLCLPIMSYCDDYDTDDTFVEGGLLFYRWRIIETVPSGNLTRDEETMVGEFIFRTQGVTETLILTCGIEEGFALGVYWEIVSRYIFEHPEVRNKFAPNIIILALDNHWPGLKQQLIERSVCFPDTW